MSEHMLIDSKKLMKESRITLSKEICSKLNVRIGDIVVFIEDSNGDIIIKKAAI